MLHANTLYVKSRFIIIDFSGTGGVTPGVKVQSIINKSECSMRFHLLFKMLSFFKTLNTVVKLVMEGWLRTAEGTSQREN